MPMCGTMTTEEDGRAEQSEPLLSSAASTSNIPLEPAASSRKPSTLSRASKLRSYWLAAVLCCGGALFGYDSGVIGGVLTFDSFQRDFHFGSAEKTLVSSIGVGIQQAGALVGCFAVWPVANRLGRRIAMMVCSAVFCAGVVLEVWNTHSLPVFYVGRVICGLGIGGAATVIPIYMAEMSPKEIRGRLGSCYQLTYTIGIFVSYWVDYAVKFMDVGEPGRANATAAGGTTTTTTTCLQWQIPVGLQLLPGALMGIGMLTLDESVRWLLARGDHARALRSLIWMRAGDSTEVRDEFAEMVRGVDDERRAQAGLTLSELLCEWPNAHRLLIAGGLFLAQQSTGATALAYFGPQFFSVLVGGNEGPNTNNNNTWLPLLLTGVFGAVKVIACFVFVAFVSDRFGRRPLLMIGAAVMAICMVTTAVVVNQVPATSTTGSISSSSILTITLIYINITFYNLSWGPLPWPCASEIFPTRIRDPGVAFAVGAQWFFNFVWSFSTPYLMASSSSGQGVGIGAAGTFLLFGLFDLLIVLFVWCCVRETKGLTLEEISGLFEATHEEDGRWKPVDTETDTEE